MLKDLGSLPWIWNPNRVESCSNGGRKKWTGAPLASHEPTPQRIPTQNCLSKSRNFNKNGPLSDGFLSKHLCTGPKVREPSNEVRPAAARPLPSSGTLPSRGPRTAKTVQGLSQNDLPTMQADRCWKTGFFFGNPHNCWCPIDFPSERGFAKKGHTQQRPAVSVISLCRCSL